MRLPLATIPAAPAAEAGEKVAMVANGIQGVATLVSPSWTAKTPNGSHGSHPLGGEKTHVAPTPPAVDLVEDLASLKGVLPLLAREEVVGFDLETTGLDPHTAKVRLVSLYLPSEGKAVVLDLFRLGEGVVGKLFSGEGPGLVGHNLGFDLTFLMARGLYPLGLPWDTGLVDQVLGHRARMRPLEEVAGETGIPLDKSLQASDWSGPLSEAQVRYAGLDAWAAWAIRQAQEPQVERFGLREVVAVEMAALPAVALMRLRGVPFDPGLWEEAVAEAEARKEAALARLREFEAGLLQGAVNWDSPQQALKALKALGLALPDTREDTLAQHGEHPAVKALLEYRAWAKRVSTYGRDWEKYLDPKTGRIHPSWHQIGAETGRMACSKPNLQQVPREPALRRAFRAPEGRVLVKADYSQIELRLAAVIAQEGAMLKAFREGQDLHALTASLVLGKPLEAMSKEDRQLAKALNFGLLYGLGAEGLRRYALAGYGVRLSPEEAQALREAFFRAYPGLKRWHRAQPEGEVEVRTLLGRRRATDRYTEKLNTPVQGSGADGLKLALGFLYQELVKRGLQEEVYPVLAVHDEVVVEAPEVRAEEAEDLLVGAMKRGMEAVVKGRVPVEVEAGVYWDWGVTPRETCRCLLASPRREQKRRWMTS